MHLFPDGLNPKNFISNPPPVPSSSLSYSEGRPSHDIPSIGSEAGVDISSAYSAIHHLLLSFRSWLLQFICFIPFLLYLFFPFIPSQDLQSHVFSVSGLGSFHLPELQPFAAKAPDFHSCRAEQQKNLWKAPPPDLCNHRLIPWAVGFTPVLIVIHCARCRNSQVRNCHLKLLPAF